MPSSRRFRPAPNPSGVHFLAAPRVAAELVRSAEVTTSDLVVDLGAGLGAITAPLAGTGAEIVAVERDPEFSSRLRRRFAEHGNVRVITTDARQFSFPRKRFTVVASIPYAISTTLMRRLLGPSSIALDRGALIVEWGFAKRLTARIPRDAEIAWWAARFELRLMARVPSRCFSPAPKVDSARLAFRRRERLGIPAERALWTLLNDAYRRPSAPARAIGTRGSLRACGVDPSTPAGQVAPADWAAVARLLGPDRHWPVLPKQLR